MMTPLRALLLTCCVIVLPLHARAAEPPRGIAFHDVEDTLTLAAEEGKPIVLYFTADWCPPCQRMQAEAFTDPAVIRASERFVWSKIDIDRNQPLAARFAVRGIPSFVFLDEQGQLIDRSSGYFSPTKFRELLQSRPVGPTPAAGQPDQPRLESVQSKVDQLGQLTGEAWHAAMIDLLEQLASGQHQGRDAAREALLAIGAPAYPVLLEAMGSDRLALRAVAHDLLVLGTRRALDFDPFAPAEQRATQLAAWYQALQPPATQPSEDAAPREPEG